LASAASSSGKLVDSTGQASIAERSKHPVESFACIRDAIKNAHVELVGVDNVVIRDATGAGAAGDFLGSDGSGHAVWQTPLVRIAAGVPSGAPTVAEFRFAFDSTPVTGGLYLWNGAAWVKVSLIP